jgi:hypothetical protein
VSSNNQTSSEENKDDRHA